MKNTRVLIRAKGRGLCIERGLYDCLQRELFADVTLNCDGGKIRANKGVLAAASPVLANLLKDWPMTEDACIIMAGYTEEEVQGLVQYIYTGQLSSPQNNPEGSGWEKIIEDFKVGLPPDYDEPIDHLPLQHNDLSPPYELEPNGAHTSKSIKGQNRSPGKGVGAKFGSGPSPRPMIVQVQSLTQNQLQSTSSDIDSLSDVNDNHDIPNEMSIDNGNEHFDDGEETHPSQSTGNKRKRASKSSVDSPKKSRRKPVLDSTTEPMAPPLTSAIIKKLTGKKVKPLTKFSRKKYCCPYCSRRFLTRGNVKNHMRIHSRDKPFQCSLCQDLFAYQGVYQRHLLRHRDNNEITDEEMSTMIADSVRLAGELAQHGHNPVQIADDDDEELEEELAEELGEAEELDEGEEVEESEELEGEEFEEAEDIEETDDIDEEEADETENSKPSPRGSSKVKKETDEPGSSRTDVGVHFLCTEDKKDQLVLSEDEPEGDDEGEGSSQQKEAAPVARKKPGPKGKGAPAKDKKDKPKHRMNYQIIECDYCPMKYHKWSAFYVHRCTHTGETPVLPCGVCEMEFPNIKALKEHKTTAHPSAVFQCDQCERSFLSRSALLMHQPVHSTKLNFQCRYCQAKMRTLKERYVHERIHTADETPYQCSQCDKQFNTLVNLRSHLKLHASEADPNAA